MSKSTSTKRGHHRKPKHPNRPDPCMAAGRKIRYPSRKRALTALNRLQRGVTATLRIYQCEHCKDWHFTSQPQRGQR